MDSDRKGNSFEKRVLLVLVALLCGAVAGLIAGILAYSGNMHQAILYGSGAFAAATLFILTIERALQLFDLMRLSPGAWWYAVPTRTTSYSDSFAR